MTHFNGARASREIGAGASAKKHAYRMSQRPMVEQEIHRLLALDNAQFMGARQALIRYYLAIVNVDPARLFRGDGTLKRWSEIDPEDRQAIQSIQRSEYQAPDGATSKQQSIKLRNGIEAGKALAKLLGWDRKADEGDIGSSPIRDAAESLIDNLADMLRAKGVSVRVRDRAGEASE
jgi:hypothetical protein